MVSCQACLLARGEVLLHMTTVVQDLWTGRTIQVYDDDGDVNCAYPN